MKKYPLWGASLTLATLLLAGCATPSTATGDGTGADAPASQSESKSEWTKLGNPEFTQPYIYWMCFGNNGIYATGSSDAPPVVIVDDAQCAR